MTFKRGFKSYCETTVAEVRDELRLNVHQPIEMNALAEYLGIPVHSLRSYRDILSTSRTDADVEEIYYKVSAFTYFEGNKRVIVYNDEHGPARHRSNLAHELAHALLLHPPRGSGIPLDQEELHEEEAAWMGGVLMLTTPQAYLIARSRQSKEDSMGQFGVSQEMLRYRLNVTGAAKAGRIQ